MAKISLSESTLKTYLMKPIVVSAIALTLLLLRNRKKYLDFYIIASVIIGGIFLLDPKFAVGFQVMKQLKISASFFPFSMVVYFRQVSSGVGEATSIICSVFGTTFLSFGLILFMTRETRDGTVPITLITSNMFVSSYSVSLDCGS